VTAERNIKIFTAVLLARNGMKRMSSRYI